ncbi:esterase E4-like [Battus philenor]|uniref:esterase E4-like n=1 Tax=Battus philenor TaxID=42288 RepID=UPI0035D00FA6
MQPRGPTEKKIPRRRRTPGEVTSSGGRNDGFHRGLRWILTVQEVELFSIFILLFNFNVNAISRVDPLVVTSVGLIRGLQATDGDYSMFLGIPYANVNDTNPFGLSIPIKKFDGTFQAIRDSEICPQLDSITNTIIGTIDCLQLNIYVPNSAHSRNAVPVLVWFYGGSFYRGFARRDLYGPKYIVRHDVILVTVNYRVGSYGFMCLDIPEVPGNQGLKDQLIALRWIKSNIAAFGGDVNKVTLFGQSAGGRSVDFHLVSDQEKLFDKVIMQSGNSICPPVIGEVDTRPPFLLAEKLGLNTDDVSEAMDYLSKVDPKTIVGASLEIDYTFRPCVERNFDNIETFVSDYTINKNLSKVKDTPILIGFNSNELILNYENKSDKFFENLNVFEEALAKYFDFDEQHLDDMVNIVRQYYIGDEDIGEDHKQSLADFDSDFTYLHPIYRRMYQNMLNGAENIYFYVFLYRGKRNLSVMKNFIIDGASHSDELGYLFDMPVYFKGEPTEQDQKMVDRMTTLWTNFAKFGDPTPTISDLLPVKWIPVTQNRLYYYDISEDLNLKTRAFNGRMAFWDLFYKHNRQFQKGYINEVAEVVEVAVVAEVAELEEVEEVVCQVHNNRCPMRCAV